MRVIHARQRPVTGVPGRAKDTRGVAGDVDRIRCWREGGDGQIPRDLHRALFRGDIHRVREARFIEAGVNGRHAVAIGVTGRHIGVRVLRRGRQHVCDEHARRGRIGDQHIAVNAIGGRVCIGRCVPADGNCRGRARDLMQVQRHGGRGRVAGADDVQAASLRRVITVAGAVAVGVQPIATVGRGIAHGVVVLADGMRQHVALELVVAARIYVERHREPAPTRSRVRSDRSVADFGHQARRGASLVGDAVNPYLTVDHVGVGVEADDVRQLRRPLQVGPADGIVRNCRRRVGGLALETSRRHGLDLVVVLQAVVHRGIGVGGAHHQRSVDLLVTAIYHTAVDIITSHDRIGRRAPVEGHRARAFAGRQVGGRRGARHVEARAADPDPCAHAAHIEGHCARGADRQAVASQAVIERGALWHVAIYVDRHILGHGVAVDGNHGHAGIVAAAIDQHLGGIVGEERVPRAGAQEALAVAQRGERLIAREQVAVRLTPGRQRAVARLV